MKNLIKYLFIIPFLISVSFAQTQSSLPSGSKAFSSNIYISPNADLWTGKPGTYMNLAKKRYVDSLVSNLGVSTASLKINYPSTTGILRVPAANSTGTELIDGGLQISYSPNGSGFGAIPIRNFGKIQAASGNTDLDVVNFFQLNNYINPLFGSNSSSYISNSPGSMVRFSTGSTGSNITGGNNSEIYFSDNSKILNNRRSSINFSESSSIENQTSNGQSFTNLISNSIDAHILGNYTQYTSIIGSRQSSIGRNRVQSAIIASTQSEIKDYVSGQPGFAKWNSAIIAGLLCSVGESNSYTLVTGRGNHSAGSATFICGRYNVKEPMISVDNPLKKTFVVGGGTGIENDEDTGDESLITRKNAFYVTHGGRAWVQQELEVDAAGKGVVLKSPDGSRWSITVSNTGTLQTTKLP